MNRLARYLTPWSLLLLVGFAWGIERLVVTDAEAIEQVLEDAAKSFDRKDFAALGALLHEDFVQDGTPREQALARLEALSKRFGPLGTSVDVSDIRVDDDEATSRVTVRVRALGQVLPLEGRVTLRRDGDGDWRIRGADGFAPRLR
ncbi:MAG: nuclear transport factor 2 family protein [Planctomycetota bacterium]